MRTGCLETPSRPARAASRWPWRLLSFGNEQYQIRSIATGLCLDVGASTTPRDVTHLALTPCKATDSQHWLLTPPAGSDPRNKALSSNLSDSYTDPVGLEHVQTGRMLAGEPRELDGMRVRAYPHRTQPTPNREKRIPEWVDNVRVRIRDATTGLCIQTDPNLPSDGFLGIDLRACNGSRGQTWRVQPVSENAFRLRNDQPVLGDDAWPRGRRSGPLRGESGNDGAVAVCKTSQPSDSRSTASGSGDGATSVKTGMPRSTSFGRASTWAPFGGVWS
ncbi:RICIN domain-containing protein [Streptomyces alanosinicus]|uniref:Ricin B lectin domain-containing protein n=1 Tax=Streptomyces alanosinicus TaxID=68171 RepID=A0A918YNA6_9ACTN|nr:RICIN domain-containing protein [Streptomyces alanosinicus]GHE09005.1 hypothetical protein GCM10010339_59860 [Streptomyces alanosinicus]